MAGLDNLTPVKPGQVLNPNGRPKGSLNRSTLFKRFLDLPPSAGMQEACEALGLNPESIADQLVATLLLKASTGDVNAIKEALDSAYGKNSDKTELTGADGGPIEVKDVTVRFVE